ncbi:MAG: ribose 5-phosphate isomerase B [Parcubacteria group bacterium Gr01-1014_73]|nr:MAG: ribose 5-phosphate isomerase B [Parcubacteria group bacterium Gr01-1014_73]
MRILIASDHAGFELKNALFRFLKEKKFEVVDCGPDKLEPDDDYPDFVAPIAEEVSADEKSQTLGIVIGGSGQGEAMCANRFPRVRAAVFYGSSRLNLESEKRFNLIALSRQHNNANVLAIGARFVSEEEAKKAVLLWLETSFSGETRHLRRIEKIDKLAPCHLGLENGQ